MASQTCKACGKGPTDDAPMKACSCRLEDAIYCNEECQNSDWKTHKKACQAARSAQAQKGDSTTQVDSDTSLSRAGGGPSVVQAVDLLGGYNRPFNAMDVTISSDHEIFHGKGVLSPVSKLIGQPILVYRHLRDDPFDYVVHAQRELFDNSSVTIMMINPNDGFAPPEWQQGIGRVTIARQDESPLSKLDLEKIWMYCDAIADACGDNGSPPRRMYDPEAYNKWAKKYRG